MAPFLCYGSGVGPDGPAGKERDMNTVGQRVVGSGTGSHGVVLSVGDFVTEVREDGTGEVREYGNVTGNLLPEDGPLIRCGSCTWLHDSADAVRQCYADRADEELQYRMERHDR